MRHLRATLFAVVFSCGGGTNHVEAPAPPLAACRAEVAVDETAGVAHVTVGGISIGHDAHPPDDSYLFAKAVTYPHTPTSVLVGWTAGSRTGEYYGSSELYEVACSAPASATVFASLAGASFGHGALTGDGKTLYFSGPTGVQALDLSSRALRTVTTAPRSTGCNPDKQMRDIVTGVDDAFDRVEVERAGSCDPFGAWGHAAFVVEHASTNPSARPARPVTAITVDASGTWWAGADNALWTSRDKGAHWTKGSLHAETGPYRFAIDAAGNILVQTVELDTMGAPAISGYLFTSRDHGATWHGLPLPAEAMGEWDNGPVDSPQGAHGHMGLAFAIGDSIDKVTLWGTSYATDTRETATWHTDDAGAHWTRIAATEPPPRPIAHDGSTALRPSPDGLVLEDGHHQPRLVFVAP